MICCIKDKKSATTRPGKQPPRLATTAHWSAIAMPSIPQRTCKRCGTAYYGDEVAAMFSQRTDRQKYINVNSACNPCLITARTQAKEVNRFIVKAKSTIKHHARKFSEERENRPAWVSSQTELVDRFLWDVKRIAHDMEHAWQSSCNDCGYAFQSMPNGLHDLTLDIINPGEPPYYGTNTRFVCTTCNRKKSRTPSKLWGASKAATMRWVKRQQWLKAQPEYTQIAMFSDDSRVENSDAHQA
jgi:hypothetical protein